MASSGILSDYHKARNLPPQTLWERLLKKPAKPVCYAPFSNLTFGHSGQYLVCCYNRTYVLGMYPEQSIEEAWNGPRAQEFRKYIQQNDLSHGCQVCEVHINSRAFETVPARHYDKLGSGDGKRPAYPRRLDFELSNSCNLECIMCSGHYSSSIRKNREKLPPLHSPYDEDFLRQLEPFLPHIQEATFVGGEPFLVTLYHGIWERLAALHSTADLHIQTNGTILNSRVKQLLERLRFHLGISMDSLDPELYPTIRVNGRFDEMMQNFLYFREYARQKQTSLTISFCIMAQNIHELPDWITFANRHEVPIHFNLVSHPSHCTIQSLPRETLQQLIESWKSYVPTRGTELERHNADRFQSIVQIVSDSTANQVVYSQTDLDAINQAFAESSGRTRILQKLERFVQLSALGPEAQAENHAILARKLHLLFDHFIGQGVPEDLIAAQLNHISIETIADSLIHKSEEELYRMGKSFFQ
jgi:MoaA/NifB/PqqE/SkfB family radical SAM enzyme